MRKPLSPEAKAAAIARLNDVMRKFCEDVEGRKQLELAIQEAGEFAEAMIRLCDEMGPNV